MSSNSNWWTPAMKAERREIEGARVRKSWSAPSIQEMPARRTDLSSGPFPEASIAPTFINGS
ncbi:MAG: hypothetical protein VYB54_17050 [Pseudomonadota bacterium]|nr:hypothetical protein [Pseudomonadota bacterium]